MTSTDHRTGRHSDPSTDTDRLSGERTFTSRDQLSRTGYLHFSTHLSRDDESRLLVASATATWTGSHGKDVHFDDEQVLARAQVYGYDHFADGVDEYLEALYHLHMACDIVSGDLEAVAARLIEAVGEGGLSGLPFTKYVMTSRWLILDSVEVDERVRGLGLGREVAAHALRMAGAWTCDVAIAAIAGAQIPFSRDEDEDARIKAAQAQTARSARLLEAIGLERLASDVYVGHSGLARTDSALSRACP